jgi:hypothetical protein
MYSEPTGGWIMALLATLLALWTYRLSKKSEIAHEKEFDNIELLSQNYMCLHHEEPYFMLRLKKLIKAVKEGSFGLLYENKEPKMVLLPINEFYRLKAIEERINTRTKEDPQPIEEFGTLISKIDLQPKKENEDE